MGHAGEDFLPGVPPLAVAGDGPFQAEEIIFARQGEAPSVPIPYGVRHPALGARDAVPGRVQGLRRLLFYRGKYLPISLELQLMGREPVVYEGLELFEFPLVWAQGCQIVHVPLIVFGEAALPNELVQGLKDCICKPLGRVSADHNAVLDDAPDQVKDPAVFDKFPHTVHDYAGFQTVVEVMDVAGKFVLGPLGVLLHPPLYRLLGVVWASLLDASAAVRVHPPHKDGL